MSTEPRSKRRRRYYEQEPCGEFHNPGHYPWVAACVLSLGHVSDHIDGKGNEWGRDTPKRKVS